MEGHYPHMPSHGAYYQHEQPGMQSGAFEPALHHMHAISSESLNQYSEVDEHAHTMIPGQPPPKSKRRQAHGPDHIKHRRTRSGCYTCRQRRVKCDENHPTCERCRKGKRECVYPEPNSAKASDRGSKGRSFLPDSGSNTSADEYDPADQDKLPAIPDEEGEYEDIMEPLSAISAAPSAVEFPGHDSMSPSTKEKSPTVPTEPESATKASRHHVAHRTASRSHLKSSHVTTSAKYASLPKDVRFYIRYHKDQITHHHYAIKYDGGDFLKTTFLEIALGYEPLLYAVCAFASYFHQLSLPNGKIQVFLNYYDKSVRLLRQSLVKSTRHSIATLLTILQLASFEECLGDWVNLLGHQKAAFEIILQLFTPQNCMQSETHRKVIAWYIRFDIMAGLMSGNETTLSREWHDAVTDFYTQQASAKPNDLPAAFEARFSLSRLFATNISLVFGKKAKGLLTDEEFMMALADLKRQQEEMHEYLQNAFPDRRVYIKDFPPPSADDMHDDVVDPREPNFILTGEMWTWNFIQIDFWGLSVMFKSQLAQIDRSVNFQEVVDLAYDIGKMYEALQMTSKHPHAIILGAQASVGIAATAMPKDHKHISWCRRKYAQIEKCGYIYPAVLRKRMSDAWNEDVTRWWLPEDEEPRCPPILQHIREFIDYRATIPQDSLTEDVRDMKGLFNAMSIEDPEARETKSTGSGTNASDDFIDLGAFGGSGIDSMSFESSPDMSWNDFQASTESLGYLPAFPQQDHAGPLDFNP